MTDQNGTNQGCDEYINLSRRQWMRRLMSRKAPAAAAVTAPAWMPKVTLAQEPTGTRDIMVHVFLRGGMDGLTTCVPYADNELYLARPTLAIPPPGSPGGAIDLDGFFGLAPAASALQTPYSNGDLAFIHASGSPDPTHSHFDAFQYMEFGIPLQPLTSGLDGWLARHLQTVAPSGSGLLRGVAATDLMPKTLLNAPATLPISDPEEFDLAGPPGTYVQRRDRISTMYQGARDPLGTAALDTFATIDLLDEINFRGYRPENGAVYPNAELGQAMQNTAAMIKADFGLECAMVEIGGWDTHAQQGPQNGLMASLLDTLCRSLEAFYLDLQDRMGNIVVLVMSEFGRRVAENASEGTDHGHGNAMIAMGGSINGGQVITEWPGLAPGQLNSGDLAITIDYRDVVAEILEKRMENTSLDVVFPNFTPTFRGVVA